MAKNVQQSIEELTQIIDSPTQISIETSQVKLIENQPITLIETQQYTLLDSSKK